MSATPEMMEDLRVKAWHEAPERVELWNSDEARYDLPEREWPPGVDGHMYYLQWCDELGLVVTDEELQRPNEKETEEEVSSLLAKYRRLSR